MNYVERRRQSIAKGDPPPKPDRENLYRTIPAVKLTLLAYLQDIRFEMEKKIDQFKVEYRDIHGQRPPKIFKEKVRELDKLCSQNERLMNMFINNRGSKYEPLKKLALDFVKKTRKNFKELSELMQELLDDIFSTDFTSDSSLSEISASD